MVSSTGKPFIVFSGLPGSGKSTLAQQLAPLLGLPVIDKDEILERLFEAKGTGDSPWRRALSRESDRILQADATASGGALLTSFWHLPGMPADSGTRTEWIEELSDRVVNVHCLCTPEIATARFLQRKRHPGHLDSERSIADILASIQAVSNFGLLKIGRGLDVDTTKPFGLEVVVSRIQALLEPVI
jgi:glucokinase